MKADALYPSLKVFSYVVILLMAVAVVYAGYIAIVHWPRIGV